MNPPDWVHTDWVNTEVVLAIHEAPLAEPGGLAGIRDRGMLESALARPQNRLAYSPDVSLHQLAAAYAFGLGKNHAFLDGNKRIAWLVCALFLELNGVSVIADQADVVRIVSTLVDGALSEEQFTAWLQQPDVTA